MTSEGMNKTILDVGKAAKSFIGQVDVTSSVLTSPLWLFFTASIFLLPAAYFMPDYRGVLIVTELSIIGFICFLTLFFALTRPELLQTEEQQRF